MKPVLALFVAAFVAVGGQERGAVREMHSAAGGVAKMIAEVEKHPAASTKVSAPIAATSSAPAKNPVAGVRLDKPVRVLRGRRIVNIPVECRDSNGSYDVVVHFHGAPETVEPIFANSGVKAVFVVVNLGIGSGPYENAFGQDGSLQALLTDVDKQMQKHCPTQSGVRGRVALSAWSAGYGAVYRVLGNKNDKLLVDSVLLADGLHAGFLDKYRQQINALQMAPFDAFAEQAVKGDKLFAITHTGITTTYASTTETARYLANARGVKVQKVNEQGPRPKMLLTSKADSGNFHVRGFAGGDTHAHCDHLYAIGETLFSQLRDRWAH
jgi:hypothetical protein